MARLDGVLWEYNLAKVVFVDVSDDYRFCQEPLPCEFYPVVSEAWLPVHRLTERLAGGVAEEALSGPGLGPVSVSPEEGAGRRVPRRVICLK